MSTTNIEDMYPLSPMQQGMLFHTLYEPASGIYLDQLVVTVDARLDEQAMRRAWDAVVARHTILRTSFVWEGLDEPLQVVHRTVQIPFEVLDWTALAGAEQERRFQTYLEQDRVDGFDLTQAPLMRLVLIRLAENRYHVVWPHHHLLADGWSLPIILREVFDLYEAYRTGKDLVQPPARPFSDYVAWLQKQDAVSAEAFWRKNLQDLVAPTPIPVARTPDPNEPDDLFPGEVIEAVPDSTYALIQSVARTLRVTTNTVAQGAWALLLSRYSGHDDVVFGATVSGRPADIAGVESIVGLFINTLPIRVRASGDEPVGPWLQALQARQAELRQYDYAPLVKIQQWAGMAPTRPLFESLLVFENYSVRELEEASPQSFSSYFATTVGEKTNYPLNITFVPGPQLAVQLSYDRRRYDDATMRRMMGHLQALLRSMVENPQSLLRDLPMLSPAEQKQVVEQWNATDAVYDRSLTLVDLFHAQVSRSPHAPAVVFGDETLAFDQLNQRAEAWARRLRQRGVGVGIAVGLLAERTPDALAALWGILKAGGAFLPIDPSTPRERVDVILKDADALVLLTQRSLVDRSSAPPGRTLLLDEPPAGEPEPVPPARASPADAAYIIYTSGSTGTPKGVVVEHASAVAHFHALCQTILQGPSVAPHRVAQSTSLSFDASLDEWLLSLGGHTIHPVDEETRVDPPRFVAWLKRQGIQIINGTPGQIGLLLDAGLLDSAEWKPRIVMIGGEAISPQRWTALAQRTDVQFFNFYGPTECTVDVTACRIRDHPQRPVIGRPLANTRVYVLDPYGNPCPVGVPGELCVSGPRVARGYHRRPDIDRARFVPNAFRSKGHERVYRTGDQARWLPEGTLEYLGRADDQVKLHGHRIEPGDVEAALVQDPRVRAAAVSVREDEPGRPQLVAYVVADPDAPLDVPELRDVLRTRLPEYMVPSVFVPLDKMPLRANGKVDRKALPSPSGRALTVQRVHVEPRTPTEKIVADVWTEVLKASPVGATDSFFDLGGHSILATQVVSRLNEVFGIELPLRSLFEAVTVAGVAQRITEILTDEIARLPEGADVEGLADAAAQREDPS